MRRKIMNRRGFTLVETLMVIFILALVTSAGAVGVSAVLATRVEMIQTADAEILGSTAFQAIANELRFGQNITVGDEGVAVSSVSLDSLTYGLNTKISQKNGRLTYGDSENNQMLGEKAYSGLDISGLTFVQKADGSITISLAVSGSKGKQLWSGEVTVVPLNG